MNIKKFIISILIIILHGKSVKTYYKVKGNSLRDMSTSMSLT